MTALLLSLRAFTQTQASVEGRKITVTVPKSTDVEVAILDARGNVVRHLAAGVLGGKNPPPEPLKPGP